eukprot:3326573-Prymnesium_polylepis.2
MAAGRLHRRGRRVHRLHGRAVFCEQLVRAAAAIAGGGRRRALHGGPPRGAVLRHAGGRARAGRARCRAAAAVLLALRHHDPALGAASRDLRHGL